MILFNKMDAFPFAKILLSLGLLFSLEACGNSVEISSADTESDATIEDVGDLVIQYEEPNNQDLQEIYQSLQSTMFFDDLIADINEHLIFTQDIDVIFTECDEANAYYDPEASTITMCYELIADYVAIFADEIETAEDFDSEVIDATSFTFFHELGHAVIDQYALPITGNEEDAVDNFAAIALLDVYGDDLGALSGMFQFEMEAVDEQQALEDLAFWDEHSLSSQRFYNTACLVYGSDPEGFSFIVEEGYLPEDRADGCEDEYIQKSEAWWTLMEPYFK